MKTAPMTDKEWMFVRASRPTVLLVEAGKVYKTPWGVRMQTKINKMVVGRIAEHRNMIDALGYNVAELRAHLERGFVKGMSWENYAGNMPFGSRDVWVIDHIIPKCKFHESEARQCFALSNLRPLWIRANIAKASKVQSLL